MKQGGWKGNSGKQKPPRAVSSSLVSEEQNMCSVSAFNDVWGSGCRASLTQHLNTKMTARSLLISTEEVR